MKDKKTLQLGMNPGTASHRLVKDLLFSFVSKENVCFHCGLPMERDNFSIEHKIPWMDSEDPKKAFFDLENISFSHLSCNSAAARKRIVSEHGTVAVYAKGCRCDLCREAKSKANATRKFDPVSRQERYRRTGH